MKNLAPLILIVSVLLAGQGFAQEAAPQEVAAIDARTAEVSKTLRCVVCKNQSIAESDAQLAKDLRALVRVRLEAGDTNEEARAYVVERYGEFVLLKPRFSGKNLVLWTAPFLVLVLGLVGGVAFIATRQGASAPPPDLSDDDAAILARYRGADDEA